MKFAAEETTVSEPKGHKRQVIILIVLLALIIGLFAYVWFSANPISGKGSAIKMTIPFGATGSEIASALHKQGVVGNAALFKAYEKLNSPGSPAAGRYTFYKHDSYSHTVKLLKQGPTIKIYKITFPEGFRVRQMAQRIARIMPGHSMSAFLDEADSGKFQSKNVKLGTTNLQGYLFPDTYYLAEDTTNKQIIQTMLDRFDEIAAKQNLTANAKAIGYTPTQVLTVASLIEKEVKLDQDRAPAAGVIYNRLKAGQPLQLDSTATYAAGLIDVSAFDRATQLKDRDINSPYNTFKVSGLPPGPIDSPGEAAIHAALHPTGDALYFITINDCTNETVFTKTLADFNKAVARRTAENPKKC
jgi:UPF0755 protein